MAKTELNDGQAVLVLVLMIVVTILLTLGADGCLDKVSCREHCRGIEKKMQHYTTLHGCACKPWDARR